MQLESAYATHRPLQYIQGGPKMAPFIVHLITLPNINRFLKFFYCGNQETICNETVAIDPTTPQVCRYTTSWDVRWRTQAGDAINQFDRAWHVAANNPRLKSGPLCSLGYSSTGCLSVLTIHVSQPAEAGDCHWAGQTATAFGWSHHWSVASPAWVRRPAARQIRWTFDVKTVRCDFKTITETTNTLFLSLIS